MAKDDWRDGGNRMIRPGQGSGGSSTSSGSSKGGGSSSSGGAFKGGGSSGSGYGGGSSSSGAGRGWNPGDIVHEGGRDYIRSSTGMKVPLDSDAGRRVQSQYAGGGGSSGGGYNQTTKVLSDYIGPNGGYGGYGQYDPSSAVGMKAADYLNSNYTPGSAYTSDPWGASAVGRLRNGMLVDRDYLEKHPDVDVYPLTYKATNYKSTVDEFGNIYNHLGQKWGTGGIWTYDELPDYAKAKQDWNFGVSPGYSYPKSDAYNDAYNWYNGTYGVAADDAHPLSQGQRAGGGTYWAAGGTGVGGPEYRPNQLYYSVPDGSGGYGAAGGTAGGAAYGGNSAYAGLSALSGTKMIPNTGIYSGDYEDYMSDAERAALRAQREATRLAQQQYENQIPDIQEQADDAARQAYVNMRLGQNNLPQQMAAMGYGGGLTESTLLGLNTDYENTRSGVVNSRDAAIRSLRNQMAAAGAQGEMSEAQIQAQFAQQRAEQLLAQRQSEMDWQRQLQLLAYQNQLDLDSYEKQQAIKAKYDGASGGTSKPRLTAAQAYDAYVSKGIRTPETVSAYEYYYGAMPNAPGISSRYISQSALDSWTPEGKAAYIRLLADRGLSQTEIANIINGTMGW
ncbi:hypothetical protein [Anaerotruncus massiliensis (ex Togo et al. 2019)]|uniref:hypothetical protein n=2 Tax=Anaerotruncus TaxID=244127 RepID=UPI00208865B0|nr:hypothetical protein [Anaerotruncus massiliensis (ex Togo et al. 2019)]GKH47068.1 hypothetical protein CE91St45_16300 [Oscillospiraceae bacterium]